MVRVVNIFIALILLLTLSCKEEKVEQNLKKGFWRGIITAQGQDIPFLFHVIEENGALRIELEDGETPLIIDSLQVKTDSVIFDLHIFDATIKAKIGQDELSGIFVKNYAQDYILPFKASFGETDRFIEKTNTTGFDGKWETIFTKKDGSQYPGIGVFRTEGDITKGTFMTKTGDYRFLEGYALHDTLNLFTFDGNHLYKFRATKLNDSIIKGEFWSGKTGYYTFTSKRNNLAELPDPEKLTYLKQGFDRIEFKFPSIGGDSISLNDKKYQNKVIILQVLGTWCPNCMDETKFLAQWYRKNRKNDVAIIGLAYENKKQGVFDLDYAISRVQNMKKQLNADYDFVIAGESNAKSASESLPMLNKIISFPTTIIIDKQGKVRKIHTGFNGPATGKLYDDFVHEFDQFINTLIQE